jgi:hypothetical protein
VNQHGPALSAKGRDRVSGLGKHQIQVGVTPGAGAVDQPYLEVIGETHASRRYLGAAKPTQRHDGIHAVRRLLHGIDAAKQNQAVVRVDGERTGMTVRGVIEHAVRGHPSGQGWPC